MASIDEFITSVQSNIEALKQAQTSMDGAKQQAEELSSQFQSLANALTIAVDRRFPGELTHEVISAFAEELKHRFPQNADEIKPEVVSALLRTVDGADGLLEPFDRDDLMSMEYLITYAIISEQLLTEEQLNEYVAEVIAAADSV